MDNGFYIDIDNEKTRVYPATLKIVNTQQMTSVADPWAQIIEKYDAKLADFFGSDFNGIIALPDRSLMSTPASADDRNIYNYYYSSISKKVPQYSYQAYATTKYTFEVVPYRPTANALYFGFYSSSNGNAPIVDQTIFEGAAIDRTNKESSATSIGKYKIESKIIKSGTGYCSGDEYAPHQYEAEFSWNTGLTASSYAEAHKIIQTKGFEILEGEEYVLGGNVIVAWKTNGHMDNFIYVDFYTQINELRFASDIRVKVKYIRYSNTDDLQIRAPDSGYRKTAFANDSTNRFGPSSNSETVNSNFYVNFNCSSISADNYDIFMPLRVQYEVGSNRIRVFSEDGKIRIRNPFTQKIIEINLPERNFTTTSGRTYYYLKLSWSYNDSGDPYQIKWDFSTSTQYSTDTNVPFPASSLNTGGNSGGVNPDDEYQSGTR